MYIEFNELTACDDRPMNSGNKWSSQWKGAIAGAAGGLLAAWVMNQFQSGVSKLTENVSGNAQWEKNAEDATVKAASAISETVADHPLSQKEKTIAGPAVHYVFGSTMGALYGIAAELNPKSSGGWGAPFGAALWLAADELAVPVLGLSGSPSDTPVTTHASAFAAHIVYGFTTEAVRRAVRAALA